MCGGGALFATPRSHRRPLRLAPLPRVPALLPSLLLLAPFLGACAPGVLTEGSTPLDQATAPRAANPSFFFPASFMYTTPMRLAAPRPSRADWPICALFVFTHSSNSIIQ